MSKFTTPHMELRLCIPLNSTAWDEFQGSKAFAALAQAGLFNVQTHAMAKGSPKASKEQKGRGHA